MTNELDAALAVAHSVADAADTYTLPHFEARDFTVDWKQNQTEVSEIDRNAERQIVRALRAAFPDDDVFGEEYGLAGPGDAQRRWVVDPIDGTSGFVRGIPVWATLIGLLDAGRPVLGVVSAPALGFRWWGGVGLGAHVRNARGVERPMSVSTVSELAESQVSITHSSGWDALGLTPALIGLQQRARRSRGMGDFWQHMLVAEGAMDLAVDAIGVAPYDLAAILPIVEAAGGRFTDRHGEATHEHDSAISSNGLLHGEVIESLTN